MKKIFPFISFFFNTLLCAQSPAGYWYGNANPKMPQADNNNYLIELILEQENNNVKGVLNYFFRNTYRSMSVRGTYNAGTRLVYLANIPVPYFGSSFNKDVECAMDLAATLRVSLQEAALKGAFISQQKYKYTCPEVTFTLRKSADSLNKDSILTAIRTFKEIYQQWRPSENDTLVTARIQPRNVINYVVSNQYREREKTVAGELNVQSDTLKVDFYDNGEIDGDSISVFFNDRLIAFNRILSTRSVHFDIILDSTREINELSMFADNLGTIPPNTALMVVSDSRRRYEVRLLSNFEKSAAVRIRRKKG